MRFRSYSIVRTSILCSLNLYLVLCVQDCVGTYPADNRCRAQEAHSKWHEENGNGLLDLMFLR